MEKLCGRCGHVKALDEFYRRGRGHQAWCKVCSHDYTTEHYQVNKAHRMRQARRWMNDFERWYASLKDGKPCADCGQSFHRAAMQWDHLPGTSKHRPLAELCRTGNAKKVMEEIAKCELVCANCHAVRTFRRRRAAIRGIARDN